MGIVRQEGWEISLRELLEQRANTTFAWGSHDCCALASSCVEALTGADVWPQDIPEYTTKEEAQQILSDRGGIEELVSSVMGDPVTPQFARRGDVVQYNIAGMPTLGVCVGAVAAFPALVGLVHVPMSKCLRAWRVG